MRNVCKTYQNNNLSCVFSKKIKTGQKYVLGNKEAGDGINLFKKIIHDCEEQNDAWEKK